MTAPQTVNRPVVATVAREQAGELTQRLVQDGFYVTQAGPAALLDSIPVSLWIGLDEKNLPRLLAHIRELCQTHRRFIPAQMDGPWREGLGIMIEAEVGGAVVYVLEVERFEQL